MVRHLTRVDGAARRNPPFVLCRLLGVAILGWAALPARSSGLIWDGAGESPPDGRFNESINWNDDTQFPEAGDTATFNINEEYSVTFNVNAVSDALTVAAGSPLLRGVNLVIRTYDVGPAGAGAYDLVVHGGGSLHVGPSMTINVHDLIKVGDVGNGTIVVNGTRSAFNVLGSTGNNLLAQAGNAGTLTYSNGAQGTIVAPLLLSPTDSFSTSASLNVLSDADVQVGSLDIATSSAITTAGARINVADAGSTLTMSGASTLTLGGAINALGTVSITSSGVFHTGTGAVTLNRSGHILVDGGTLNLNGDTTVDGGSMSRRSGSLNLAPGRTITAKNDAQIFLGDHFELGGGTTWNIQSGADLIGNFDVNVACCSGSATVVVDGAGSSMQVTNGVVASTWGHTGHTAHVTIRNGATASLGHVDLAFGGFPGTSGTLNIQSGAVTTMGNLNVATNVLPTTTGTINIDGAGSRLTQNGASTLILGHASAGSAILNIRNGGRFDTGTGAVNILATGRVLLNGTSAPGTFHAKGPMTVRGTLQLGEAPSDAGGVLDVDAGLTIDGGTVSFRNGLVDANAITLANGGVFDFDDGMLHVDSFNGNLVNEAGTLAPGHSVGATAISGNYTQQSAATLQLEIGGIFPGQWDTVAVEGNASVDGVIDVALIGGFQPVLGNSFTVLTTNVGNVGGQFDAEVFPIFNGLTFDVVYNPKSVALQVVAASGLPGDYNEDGTVNAADYVVWRKSDGTQEGYNLWRANFGRTGGAGAVAHGIVPEPASAFFLVLATACMFLARPRHK